MLSSLDPAAQQFLNTLNRIGDRMGRVQRQVSTGVKVAQVSDAPAAVPLILAAQANVKTTEQILANLGRVKSEVDAGEQALQSAVQVFDQVQTLGAQGDTDTQTAEGRAVLALQLDSLLQQLVGLAGTAVEGRYIFAGDTDQQAPYTYDATQAVPLSAYLGSSSTRVAQHPNGTTFPVALTAQQIFDSADPTTNVFAAVQNLSAALKSNDMTTIQTAVSGLSKVGGSLNSQLAQYGNTQNKIAAATDFGKTLQVQLKTQLSNMEDADLTESILEMTQGQTQQQAALESQAKLPRSTLFDYLG
jgi:flagellar hook-associated protein 3 FlgL